MFLSAASRITGRAAQLWKAIGLNAVFRGGFVGIGQAPDALLTVNAQSGKVSGGFSGTPIVHVVGPVPGTATSPITISSFGAAGQFLVQRADGTLASPSPVASGAAIMNNPAITWDGVAYNTTGSFKAVTGELQSSSSHGTYWSWFTTPLGTTALAESFRANPSGGLSCGTTTDFGAGVIAAGNFLTSGGFARVTSQYNTTSSSLGSVTGLSATLAAGISYFFRAVLFTTSNSAGGVQVAITGSATASAIIYEALVHDAGAVKAQTRATALNSAVGGVTAVSNAKIEIEGLITVLTGGTLVVDFAQNASNASASSVLVGSYLQIFQIT